MWICKSTVGTHVFEKAFLHYTHTSPVLAVCLWSSTHIFSPLNVLSVLPLLLQVCRWMYTRALSVSGRSRTVPVSMAASRTCTSTTSSRTSPRPRWSLAWYRAASPARRSTAYMASASLMGSRDRCATASQAGAGRTVTSLLPTPARAASMLANRLQNLHCTPKIV